MIDQIRHFLQLLRIGRNRKNVVSQENQRLTLRARHDRSRIADHLRRRTARIKLPELALEEGSEVGPLDLRQKDRRLLALRQGNDDFIAEVVAEIANSVG